MSLFSVVLQEDHEAEFNELESIENHIKSLETTEVAKSRLNLKRNRYKDIVPYDSNILYLESTLGNPPSRYINASMVTFNSKSIIFY